MYSWADIEQFFCRGALNTFAANAEPLNPSPIPGAKVYIYTEEDLQYIDMYVGRRSGENDVLNQSSGQTLINLSGQPIWTMSYDGWHLREDGVKKLLTDALSHNYRNNVFHGGRGPRTFKSEDEGLIYHNFTMDIPLGIPENLIDILPKPLPSFIAFKGFDFIVAQHVTKYFHNFQGKALIDKLP